ncbi:MAG: hypothetical protein DI629_20620 [Mesorhizobium amorphae]|nr:MAG: hypothetical protein DI629_20620 [Mesorhizobium amorphae]
MPPPGRGENLGERLAAHPPVRNAAFEVQPVMVGAHDVGQPVARDELAAQLLAAGRAADRRVTEARIIDLDEMIGAVVEQQIPHAEPLTGADDADDP